MKYQEYISINKIAQIKGLKSNRSLRIGIQKGKYIAREISVNGGTSYEILFSSLEIEIQEKLIDDEIKSTALVPVDNKKLNFVSESARLTSLARVDLVTAYNNLRVKYKTKKEGVQNEQRRINCRNFKESKSFQKRCKCCINSNY